MIIDGKTIAEEVLDSVQATVKQLSAVPTLVAVTCAPNFETQKYLRLKQAKAESVGIILRVVELPATTTTEECIAKVKECSMQADGLVVQLPLPVQIDREAVIGEIPVTRDPDGFKYGQVAGACLSPVVGAIDEISHRHGVIWHDKKVVVLGQGKLVGIPAAHYARQRGAQVSVYDKHSFDPKGLKEAEIIISGMGQPGFVVPDMVREGVVVFDAGTSEEGGVLVGDVAREVSARASLMTPVPGGIGPITIACLLRNLVELVRQ